MHKKLSFNTAKERRSKVYNFFFFNSHYNCDLRGRNSCKNMENRVMYPHVNKKLDLFFSQQAVD
jgi:hypothetical protein